MNDVVSVILVVGLSYAHLIPEQGHIFPVVSTYVVFIYLVSGKRYLLFTQAFKWFVSLNTFYFLLMLVSIFVLSIDKRFAFALSLNTLNTLVVGSYLAHYYGTRPPSRLLRILTANGWIAAIIIFLYFKRYGLFLRSTGIEVLNSNINMLAAYMVLGLAALLNGKVLGRYSSKNINWYTCLTTVVFIPAIALTYSRAAIFFTIAIVGLYIVQFLFLARYRFKTLITVLSVLSISMWLIYNINIEQYSKIANWKLRFEDRITSRLEHGDLHIYAYKLSSDLFMDAPIFGIGYGNFKKAMNKAGFKAIRAHSDLFENYVEMGVIGGSLFLLILLNSSMKWWWLLKDQSYRPFAIILIFLVSYMFVRPMQTVVIWHLFVLLPFMVKKQRS